MKNMGTHINRIMILSFVTIETVKIRRGSYYSQFCVGFFRGDFTDCSIDQGECIILLIFNSWVLRYAQKMFQKNRVPFLKANDFFMRNNTESILKEFYKG